MKACKACFDAAIAGGNKQKLCAFCEKGVENLAMDSPNEYWVFRSKHSKPLEQCSLVTPNPFDDKRVQVLRLSDGRVSIYRKCSHINE